MAAQQIENEIVRQALEKLKDAIDGIRVRNAADLDRQSDRLIAELDKRVPWRGRVND